MTKVSIIDVTLGLRVDDIITDNVVSLTGKARQELDTAIEERKQIETVKNQRVEAKKASDDKVTNAMTAAYELLESAGENGVVIDNIMEIVKGPIPNTSAFSLRMRKILKSKENPYRLTRKKRKGKAIYTFEPFNQE